MSYENPDGDKGYQDDDYEKQNKRKILLGKKTEGKKGQKDKGYIMFDEEDSDESLVTSEDVKSPSKLKKPKGFKFSTKKKEKEKDEKKEIKKEEKEKEKKKEGKEHKKHKKDKKKNKLEEQVTDPTKESEKAIFGVPLSTAVERNRCYDGIELPAMFRECIGYIEEHGLSCEGIYRISGVKSKIQQLKDCYNKGAPVFLEEHEPNIVASLLKQFLRELPEPVLTKELMPKFEEASTLKTEKSKVEKFNKLIHDLPKPNRTLLSWMMVHMTHVIERQKENKMTLQNVSIVLSPTMQISHRVLNVLFSHVKQLFKHVELKKYKPPIKPAHSKWSLELPDSPAQLEEELLKQEALLNNLHEEIGTGVSDQEKEEQLWEVQRVVTQLKRKIKLARKGDVKEKRKSDEIRKPDVLHEEEELKLELKQFPVKQKAPQPPSETTNEIKDDKDSKDAPKRLKDIANEAKGDKASGEEKLSIEKKDEKSSNEKTDEKSSNEKKDEKLSKEKKDEKSSNEKKIEKSSTEKTDEKSSNEKIEEKSSGDKKVEELSNDNKEEKMKEETGNTIVTQAVIEQDKNDERKEDITPEIKQEGERKDGDNIPIEDTQYMSKDQIEDNTNKDNKDIAVKVEVKEEAEIIDEESSDDEFEQQVEQILEQQKDIQAREFSEDSEAGTIEEEPDVQEISTEPSTESTVDAESTDILPSPEDQGIQQQSIEELAHTAEQDVAEFITVHESKVVEEDEELIQLQEEDHKVKLEEEELLAIERELKTKIETEKNEIERLQQEITELQFLRQDSDLEEYSSTSDSSSDSEDEEDLQEILNEIMEKNEALEKENADLCNKIHEERMICLAVKVHIRMLQQKQNLDLEKDLLW